MVASPWSGMSSPNSALSAFAHAVWPQQTGAAGRYVEGGAVKGHDFARVFAQVFHRDNATILGDPGFLQNGIHVQHLILSCPRSDYPENLAIRLTGLRLRRRARERPFICNHS
jgi:hypothetical protein